jgi:hypothetical protein
MKKYEWEVIPWTDFDRLYCIWVDNLINKTRLRLSNTSDCNESIIIENEKELDELIERLQKAREIFIN